MAARHFVIAGAQRAGTSSLWRLLDGHPEIRMARPLRPEPKYFLDEGAWRRGAGSYRSRLFPGGSRRELHGEKSTSYLERPEAALRIRHVLPEARIVLVLRDPVERALSNYWFSVESGVETLEMEEAFAREEERRESYDRRRFSVSPFAYRARGLYDGLLTPWETAFSPDQLKVVLFERLLGAAHDAEELAGLLRFLGVVETAGTGRAPPRLGPALRHRPAPSELCRELAAGFRDSSLAVARRHGLDLSCWPSVATATRSTVGRL